MRPVLAILTLACWVALGGTAAAQSDSHIPITDWGGPRGSHDPAALRKILDERLVKRPPQAVERIDPELVQGLAKMLQNDKEKWQEILKANPELEKMARGNMNDPKIREKVKEFAKYPGPHPNDFKQKK